jgi:hypothetical protein
MTSKRGTFKGAVHVHTQLSHDGVHTLPELKNLFQNRGFHFVCLTDHSQDVSQSQYEALRTQCTLLSDDQFVFIPGLEYSCDGEIHIMGIGITAKTEDTAPALVIDHIHTHGGVAVLSHPSKSEHYLFSDVWIKELDGAEIWNRAVDSLLVPQARTVDLFFKFRNINPKIYAFFGLDLHRQKTLADIGIIAIGGDGNFVQIVEALRQGQFVCWSLFFRMPATSSLTSTNKWIMSIVKSLFNGLRYIKGRL